jgi:curved DNA-binding protein CbpA
MDLYQTLGVGRAASKKEIRRAYRQAAKQAHPDSGGSPEKFRLVQTAHLVLIDDQKRSHYDQTGEVDEPGPDNETSNILAEASQIIDITLGNLIKANRDPKFSDVIAEMRQVITGIRASVRKEIATFADVAKKWDVLVGRFSTKDGPNRMDELIRGKISQLHHMTAAAEGRLSRIAEVEKMIAEYTYRQDQKPLMSDGPMMMTLSQLTQGGFFGKGF